uniref:Uncharacterized protein n=1 Tax=Arundo donax TaxID=35708 RepID=A0A0A9CE42_ARUDO
MCMLRSFSQAFRQTASLRPPSPHISHTHQPLHSSAPRSGEAFDQTALWRELCHQC